MRRLLALALVPVALLSIACGKPYQVVRETEPNPFTRPGCKLAVEPVHAEQLRVGEKSEPEYLADKNDDQRRSHEEDKRASLDRYVESVKQWHSDVFMPGGTPDNTFVMRTVWLAWEPGYYAYVASRPGVAQLEVQIFGPGGAPLDVIRVQSGCQAMSTGERMRCAFTAAAHAVHKYFDDRWVCAQ